MKDDQKPDAAQETAKPEEALPLQSLSALSILSQTLLSARKQNRMEQTDVAEAVGCHPSFITKMENLRFNSPLPSYARTSALEDVFGMERRTLWELVEAARCEMEAERLNKKLKNNKRAFAAHQEALIQKYQPHLRGTKPKAAEKDQEAENAIEELMPRLRIAMRDPANREMLSLLVLGMASKEEQAS